MGLPGACYKCAAEGTERGGFTRDEGGAGRGVLRRGVLGTRTGKRGLGLEQVRLGLATA